LSFLVNGEPLSFVEWPKIPRLSRGVVVFHSSSNTMFKKTLEKDDAPKGQA
jgi:hypothetical protein